MLLSYGTIRQTPSSRNAMLNYQNKQITHCTIAQFRHTTRVSAAGDARKFILSLLEMNLCKKIPDCILMHAGFSSAA